MARDLSVRLTKPPGGTMAARTFTLFAGADPTKLTCEIRDAATTCNSSAAAATIPPGTPLRLEANVTVFPPQNAAGVSFGWRATTP